MAQHELLLQQQLDAERWEDVLHQWSKPFPQNVLGMRLITLLQETTPTTVHPLLEEILQQYRQPENERRWRIFDQAKAYGFSTPVGALALSQFWSHGSMSPDELPPVYPDPQLSPQLLHVALVMLVMQLAETPTDGVRQLIARCTTLEVA